MKQMRASSASLNAGLFDDDQRAEYESMFDQQLALSLSRGRGLGLADSIMRFLDGPGANAANAANASNASSVSDAGPSESLAPVAPSGAPVPHAGASVSSPGAAVSSFGASVPASGAPFAAPAALARPAAPAPGTSSVPASPDDFVSALWPHAERAARRLGVAPDVLVAQAALETGWGRHMIRDGAGRSALNLFGIKAGGDWRGPRVSVSTVEFVSGVPERRREPFRAYASIAASFDDYVDFLQSRSRYAQALGATTAEDYLRGLQAAGYATDPGYADKILAILERGLPGAPESMPSAVSTPSAASAASVASAPSVASGASIAIAPSAAGALSAATGAAAAVDSAAAAASQGVPAPQPAADTLGTDQLARASADNVFEAGFDANAGGDPS